MRGGDLGSEALFSYLNCEARVPLDHPLRPIQKIVDEALGALTGGGVVTKTESRERRPG